MKRISTLLITACLMLFSTFSWAQQRYLDEVFSSVTVDTSVSYGHNIDMLYKILGYGPGIDAPLKMDVYTPTGDTATSRPVIIYVHTGSFLPIQIGGTAINQQATGSRKDSTCAEMCRQFARRGYVAVSIDYRLGWQAAASGPGNQDIRTGTLLRAVYRGLQDTRTCVRYFKNAVITNTNTYRVDTSRIVVGGQGSGGYIAFAAACLKDQAGTEISKFLDQSGPTPVSYVNPDSLGDIWGFGGIADTSNPNGGNIPNYTGISSNVAMVFNMGGALGDSSWMHAGDAPVVAFHVPGDPFAPYMDGAVIVPTTGDFVVDVRGSYTAMQQANALGNNDSYNSRVYNDAYTTRANSVNNGVLGLFPLYRPSNESAPWEWWDQNAVPATSNANGLASNPNMSKTMALRYIDSMQNYLAPRMVVALGLPGEEGFPVGINDQIITKADMSIYPNPANSAINVAVRSPYYELQSISLYDVTGRLVRTETVSGTNNYTIERKNIDAGVYFLNVAFSNGEQANTKVIFQ